jgi:uncharacterized protein (TIGR03000 family)
MSRIALATLLAVAVLSTVPQASSAFGHRGGCGWGGCGYGGWGYGGWGYSGWGYSGCGYGGCYSGYGGWGGWGSTWGYGGWGPGAYYGQVRRVQPAAEVASPALPADSGLLAVSVPADAKVFVNNHPTKSTGASRQYVSRALQAGSSYTFKVRAEFVRDGKPMSQEKTVQLTAGQTAALEFGDPAVQTAEGASPALR